MIVDGERLDAYSMATKDAKYIHKSDQEISNLFIDFFTSYILLNLHKTLIKLKRAKHLPEL